MSGALTESQKVAQDLEAILAELNEESIADMPEEKLIEYRKKLNPYGRTIDGADNYLTFSFTNLKEKYMEKLLMTGMIGYLNRALDEWRVPDAHPVIPVYDFVDNPKLIDEYHKNWNITDKIKKEIEENKAWMQKRVIVKEFLEEMFQFNPDKHVRSAYKPQPKDLSRNVVNTPAANLAIEHLKKKDIEFREQMLEFDRVQKLIEMKEGSELAGEGHIKKLVADKLVLPDQHYLTMDFSKWSIEDKNLLRTTCSMIPPVDIYHKFRNYFESNYDKLREAVQYLYCEKPDFDIAINPYSWHKSEEEAEEFQKKHRSEVITDIIKAHSGKWNFFAPFEKVRESMKYFNDNTIVLEEITKQIEKDAKLGAELVKNRIKQKKKQNVKEDGPDAEYFAKWKEQNSALKEMGALDVNKDSYAPEDCPDDAVTVDIFKFSKGGLEMEKTHFFTKAVAPTTGSIAEEDDIKPLRKKE